MGLTASFWVSCKKYLAAPQNSQESLLTTVAECQLLLNNYTTMNTGYPSDGEASADNYFVAGTVFKALSSEDQQIYTWLPGAIRAQSGPQWVNSYQVVVNSNLVLEALNGINPASDPSYNSVKGQALFFRAYAFYQIAQLYCKPYTKATAAQDPGIPIRLSSDINAKSLRGTVQQTYDQITSDLQAAVNLLPVASPVASTPNKAAAYSFLARTYLAMADYTDAGNAANQCLQLQNALIDYNTISKISTVPFSRFNKEVIFQSVMAGSSVLVVNNVSVSNNNLLNPQNARIDSSLYVSYDNNDLRKRIFFKGNTGANAGTFKFTGNYDGTPSAILFNGIATDEMYLDRAECYARAGNTASAMADLNALLTTRYATGTFTGLTAADANDALSKILTERRKELLFRGLRWTDLRRLNLSSTSQSTLTRTVTGQTYTLPPNDPRYELLLPADVIANSTMPQNPR